jgi:hypothetical protein
MTRLWHAALVFSMVFPNIVLSLRCADSFAVGGVVVDSQSHKPLANARISLAPTTARVQKVEQTTKPDGQFAFMVTQPGKYTLQITKPGYPVQFYRRSWIGGLSSAIVVRDDQDTSHLVFDADRGSAITGQINDENSEPVGNALVTVFQASVVGGERKIVMRRQTRADARGEFRVSNLLRGNYYICAMGRPWFADTLLAYQMAQESIHRLPRVARPPAAVPPDRDDAGIEEPEQARTLPEYSPDPDFRGTAFLTTFYPRASSVEEASLVRVEAGGETQISIALAFSKAVSVKGKISFSGDMSGGRANLLKKVHDQYVLFLQAAVSKDGTFDFQNVAAGAYEIVGASDSGSGASSWNARQEIQVGSSDMEITLQPGFLGALAGRLLFDGERPPSTSNLFVTLRNEEGRSTRVQVDSEGNFSLSRILPGRYEVAAGSADYVAAYFSGPTGERLPLTLDITSGEPLHRDLMLTKAVSVIEGTVEKSGMPQVAAFVLLMPKNQAQRWAYRVDQTDSDGSFRLATIPSGDYYLIALTDGENVVYRDAKVATILSKSAKTVHIEPGGHPDMKIDVVETTTLHLPPS